jgi:hypothetical protein
VDAGEKVLIENWRNEYNQLIPHGSLNYQPPAPLTIKPKLVDPFKHVMWRCRPA